MSGHSKWSTIKRQKQATDKSRGLAFTKLANAIMMAVKEGGAKDPAFNFRLRLAIDKAKSANMPKANIDRAIERGLGQDHDKVFHEVLYEGFAAHGVAIMAEGLTDNHQRTAAEVKNIFQRFNGVLGGVGSAAYLFDRVGAIIFDRSNTNLEDLYDAALETNALNISEQEMTCVLFTPHDSLEKIRRILEQKGFITKSAELVYIPKSKIVFENSDIDISQIVDLIESLEESADIHKVYTNMDLESL